MLSPADSICRLQSWRLRLLDFDYDVVHRDGIKYQAAYTLSRRSTTDGEISPFNDDIPVLLEPNEYDRPTSSIGQSWYLYPTVFDNTPRTDLPAVLTLEEVPDRDVSLK